MGYDLEDYLNAGSQGNAVGSYYKQADDAVTSNPTPGYTKYNGGDGGLWDSTANFAARAKDDLVNTVSNYIDNTKQSWNDINAADRESQNNFLNSIKTHQAPDMNDTAVFNAEKKFVQQALEPVVMPASFVVPALAPVAGALFAGDIIDDAANKGVGHAFRSATYGPATDFLSQDNLGQQWHDKPISTTYDAAMSLLPPAMLGRGIYKGAKELPSIKDDLVNRVSNAIDNKLNSHLDELDAIQPHTVRGLDALDQYDSPTRGFRPATAEEMNQWKLDEQYQPLFDQQQPESRFSQDTPIYDMPRRMQGEAVNPLMDTLNRINQQKWDDASGEAYGTFLQKEADTANALQSQRNAVAGDILMSPTDRMEVGADLPQKTPYSGPGMVFGEEPATPRKIILPDNYGRQVESPAPREQPFKLPTAEDLVNEGSKRLLDSDLRQAVNTRNYAAVNDIVARMQKEGIETPLSRAVTGRNIEYSKAQKPPSNGGFNSSGSKYHPDNMTQEIINTAATKMDQPKVDAFVDGALSDRPQFNTMSLRETTPYEVERIKNITNIDTTGFKHEIDTNNLRHALNQHGDPLKEAARNQLPITPNDLKRIPEIINSPDNIKRGSDSGPHKSIIYEKTENGTTYYVETVMPSKGVLRSKTMWKKPTSADRAVSGPPYTSTSEGLPPNPERRLTSSFDNNIPQTDKLFNGKDGKEYSASRENMSTELLNKAHEAGDSGDFASAVRYAEQSGNPEWARAYKAMMDTNGGAKQPAPNLTGKVKGSYDQQNITKRDFLNRVSELFLPVRTGRIGQRGVEGFANHNTGIIRTRNYGDLDVAAHEVGHVVDAALDLRGSAGAFDGEFARVVNSRFGKEAYSPEQVRGEGIAEFMRDYIMNPEQARSDFPKYHAAFEAAIKKNTDVAARVNEFRDMARVWREQSPEARGRAGVSYSKDMKPNYIERAKDSWFKAQEYWLDDKVGLAKFTNEYQKITGEKLATTNDPYKMARLSQNSAVARAKLLVDGDKPNLVKDVLNESYNGAIDSPVTIKSILEGLNDSSLKAIGNNNGFLPLVKNIIGKDRNGTFNYLENGNFKEWHEALDVLLVAKRQKELQGIYPDYEGPISRSDVEAIIKNAPDKLHEITEKAYQYNDNLLRILRNEGLIKPEVYDILKEKYKNYVPMIRDFSDTSAVERGFGIGSGYGNVRAALKPIDEHGSTQPVVSPLESMVKNTYAMLNLVERNNVGKVFAELAKHDKVGKLVEGDIHGSANTKDSTFSVWVNGEKKVYQTTPDIYRAIMSLNKDSANAITRLLAPPASILRAGATLTPDFALKNIMRDTFSAAVFSRYGFRPIIDHAAGIFHMVKQDRLFHEYEASGALQSTMVGLDRDYMQASLKGLYKKNLSYYWNHYNPVQILRGFSEALETATRLGEYGRARSKGISIEDAALSARDITLDFSKHGVYGKTANKIVAFFNASVQEPNRILQAFQENPRKTMSKIGLYITTPSVMLWAMNHDQDWYKELPAYQKNLFWVFKAGDTVYRIPKPFGLGVLFGSGPERMLDWMDSKDPQGMKSWAGQFIDSMAPGVFPTAIAPLLEWQANYSFFMGRSIVPQREEKLPDQMQYGPDTSELAKYIGNVFNLSPRKVDSLMQSYGAGMARQSLNIADAAAGKRDYKNPFSTAFTVDPTKSPQSLQDFYDTLSNMEKQAAGSKLQKTPMDQTTKRNHSIMTKANDVMQNLNKKERELLQSNLSSDEKSAKVQAVNKQQMQLAQAALKQLK